MKEVEIVLLPHEAENQQAILAAILKINPSVKPNQIKLLKRSIDARGKQVVFRLKVAIYNNKYHPSFITIINY